MVADHKKHPHTPVPKAMKTPLVMSVIVHLVVFLLVVFGLPHFKSDPQIVEAVPVELITNVSQLTTTNKPPAETKAKKTDVQPPQRTEEKTPDKPKPEIKKSSAPAPPDDDVLKEPPKPQEKVEKLLEKKPDPKPVKKKPEIKKDEKTPDPNDFDSLLKDLAPPEKQQPDTDVIGKKLTEPEPAPQVSRFSNTLSISEMDALRQQLKQCWSVMAGARNAEDLTVDIKVVINQDRTLQSAQIVDQFRYGSDTFYRAAADSARRALQNPLCTPLNLPPDKYDLWHEMTITFDPKEMF